MCSARQSYVLCVYRLALWIYAWGLLSSRNEIWLGEKLKLKLDTKEMRSQGSRGAAPSSESSTIHSENLWYNLQFTELTTVW
jgi:hypothetical protein